VAAAALSFVALSRDHFSQLVEWLARPHVAQWWTNPQGAAAVEEEFGPCVDGTDPTEVLLCAQGDQLVGLVQLYRLDDNPDYAAAVGLPDAAGIDLFIGEADRLGVGLGQAIIAAALERVWRRYPDVPCAMAGPSVRNVRSIRAFEKSGFTARGPVRVPGEEDEEMVLVYARPTGA
jgi:aminoglycoside 6'-N-acetyltransferase